MGNTFRQRSPWLLCLGLLLAGAFDAAGQDTAGPVELHLSGGTVPPGGVLALDLEVAGTVPDTLVLQLTLDTAILQVCDVHAGGAAPGKTLAYRPTATGFTLVIYGGTGPLNPGVVASVVLEATAGISPGDVLPRDGGSSAADSDANARTISLTTEPVVVTPLMNPHSADTDANGRIGFSELLRLIQLYNADGLHCDGASEDGFAPGAGDEDCAPHDLDYAGQDWRIGLSELLRGIQFYNAFKGSYRADGMGEDGFAPGL